METKQIAYQCSVCLALSPTQDPAGICDCQRAVKLMDKRYVMQSTQRPVLVISNV